MGGSLEVFRQREGWIFLEEKVGAGLAYGLYAGKIARLYVFLGGY